LASIIIDGYNLIGVLHKDLEKERHRLIERLSQYKKGKDHSIVVVFDGWKNGPPSESHSKEGGIEIIYSRLGERADSVIKRLLSTDRHHIVVTSDREIQAYAWGKNSVPIEAEEFLAVLEGSYESPDEPHSKGKGSSRQLSKKEKAKRRALEKL